MEKIKCPQCGQTLIFIKHIDGEIKCTRCKNIIRIQKEKSEEHAHTELVKQLPKTFLYYIDFNKEGEKMSSSFGGTVKLTGESEYRKALREITSNLKQV